ncbi:MAG: CHC2 zinc finger domain-containing protein [Candidatus Eremiobacterota bacterium]
MNRDELDALKAQVDLVELVRSSGVPLQQVGKNWKGRCPFHDDREASFVVNPEARLFNCFGCQTGGDCFRFLQLKEKLDFPQAVARAREFAGSLPPAPTPTRPSADVLPGGHTRAELLDQVAEHYARRLVENPVALEYLASRGLGSRELREGFRLGYADGSLLPTVPAEGPLKEALAQVGVLNPKGQEHFGGCVVVPLEHPDQGVVGLYGRKVSPWAKIKHLYLPGPKRGVFHWQALKSSKDIVLAESVLDALSLWAAGIRDVSCLYGVQGLPVDLDQALTRFGTRRVFWCLDADPAGVQAARRLSAELEARGIESFSIELGQGLDPNQVLQKEGPEHLADRIRSQRLERNPSWQALEPDPATPPPLASAPARAETTPSWQVEPTGDGFLLRFGGVEYRVTMRGPFDKGRLRVTLRVSAGDAAHIDTFDLYSHRARVTAVKQISFKLGLDSDAVEKQVGILLGQAEQWVAELADREADDLASSSKKRREMTPQEREEALEFLRCPDLIQTLLEHMEALGTIGETRGKLLAYLIGVSRRLEKPLSGTLVSQSGAGKSSLAELVELLTPPEDVILYSRLSTQALVYMPKDFLKRKLLIIEERKGAEEAEYSIRVLQSKQRLSSAIVVKDPNTGRMRTQVFEVEGPIAYLETTTNPRAINPENATRCFEIWLDESEEQTRRIHRRQRQARSLAGLVRQPRVESLCQLHHNAQRLLKKYPVHIPFAEHLTFPTRWLRTRRDNERFLSLIEAVALLHQYQRVKRELADPDEPCVEATVEDYRIAYELAQDVLKSTFHELTRSARDLWSAILQLAGGAEKPCQFEFNRRQLRNALHWQDHRLRDALAELVEMEYLTVTGGSQGRAYTYRLQVWSDEGPSLLGELTTPDELSFQLDSARAS